MKAACILLLALFSLGFLVETPETRRERERQDKAWREHIERRYDLPALRRFLAQQIEAIGHVEDLDLSKSKIAARWTLKAGVAQCGDWMFIGDEREAHFVLTWTYEDVPNSAGNGGVWKSVSLRCVRKERAIFEFISAAKSEDEYVVLLP